MTEQFKLVTNAQESKIFKSNATAIRIKCSNNFPQRYSVEITDTRYTSEKRLFPSAKISLQMTHSDWSNLVTQTAGVRGIVWGSFLAAEPPREASGEAARDFQIDLYTHPSRGSAAKTIQHSLPPNTIQYNTFFINSPRGAFQN